MTDGQTDRVPFGKADRELYSCLTVWQSLPTRSILMDSMTYWKFLCFTGLGRADKLIY
jgi:hypothetical protein